MRGRAWVGVALYDANGVWLGSYPNGADIPQDALVAYTRMEVDVRVEDVADDE